MQGNNTFHFNQVTMQEIVQHYLDTVLLKEGKKIVVTGIKYLGTASHAFEVSVTESESEGKA